MLGFSGRISKTGRESTARWENFILREARLFTEERFRWLRTLLSKFKTICDDAFGRCLNGQRATRTTIFYLNLILSDLGLLFHSSRPNFVKYFLVQSKDTLSPTTNHSSER